MTGPLVLTWLLLPTAPPRPYRACATCGQARPFHPSGKVRLNANGRRVDAWLIYKCVHCDRTWNLPLLDRVPVDTLSAAELHALQHSDPDWVRARCHDLALLRRHARRIDAGGETQLLGDPIPNGGWRTLVVTLDAPLPTSERLDRLLARALHLSREGLARMIRSGGLTIDPEVSLKRPFQGRLALHLDARQLACHSRKGLEGRYP